MALQIGNHLITNPALLAPMAGITDWPMREIARDCGAGLCISEMVTAKKELWDSKKSSTRLPTDLDPLPRPIQIAGSDPTGMAEAAKRCQDLGAGIIDINMGCPAKKVCNKSAGSALLANEPLVFEILEAVVNAVDVPVTLKTRLGTDKDNLCLDHMAENIESTGIQMLSIHGRTRACKFNGQAEYALIGSIAKRLSIPVIANGDITSPEKALNVLQQTGAAGVMIGRGAWGHPWLFGQIAQYLKDESYSEPTDTEKREILLKHLCLLHQYYGEFRGVRFARKHFDWYLRDLDPERIASKKFNTLETAQSQLDFATNFFDQIESTTFAGMAA